MRYKGILLDLDNTLYSYQENHRRALNEVFSFMEKSFSFSNNQLEESYAKARHLVQIELGHTASSHNRILYFQKMLEILTLNPLKYAFLLYNLYWNTFLSSMRLFFGVETFLETYRNRICLVTDLTAHIQYKKIKALQLENHISQMVTSEEAGREKPHPYMFLSALEKMNLKKDEVCMIGDNFKKDIVGANNLGIRAIWLNRDGEHRVYDDSLVEEVDSFEKINQLL
jgi:putative hydrolase of the HAD superfamily